MIDHFDSKEGKTTRREDGQPEEKEIFLVDEAGKIVGSLVESFQYKPQKPKGDKIFPDRVSYSEQHWLNKAGDLVGVKRFFYIPEYEVKTETPEEYKERKAQEELESDGSNRLG